MAPGRPQKVLKALNNRKGSSPSSISSDTLVGNERPTREEWRRMKAHPHFVVSDADGQEHRFEQKDIVLILPDGLDPSGRHNLESYWVGRIHDIRKRVFSDTVWVDVQWFYTGRDASKIVKSLDGKPFSSFERIFSDHFDLVCREAFEAIITVSKLSETDPYQLFIPPKSFYRRYTIECMLGKVNPKPGSETCFNDCTEGYWPEKKGIEETMRFCPRPSCRRSWHHGCLVANDCVEQNGEGEEQEGKGKKRGRPKGTTKKTIKAPIFNSTARSAFAEDDNEYGGTIRVRSASSRVARKSVGAGPPRHPPMPPGRRTRSQKEREDEEDEAEAMELLLPSQLTQSNLTEVDLGLLPLPPGLSQANGSQQDNMVLSRRALRLLKSSPESDEDVDLEKLTGFVKSRVVNDDDDEDEAEYGAPSKKRPRGRPPKKKAQNTSKARLFTPSSASSSDSQPPSLATILTTLPLPLLKIATQPLVRGGAFERGGVAGNVGFVSRARKKVYDALRMGGGAESVEDWEDEVFGDDRAQSGVGLKNALVWIKGEGVEKVVGEKRTRSGKLRGRENVGKESGDLPAFKCPNCGGAI